MKLSSGTTEIGTFTGPDRRGAAARVPKDELDRLEKIRSRRLIYSPMEDCFDSITKAAKKDFDVPIAFISLVGEDVQWLKSAQGIAVPEIPRKFAFCAHTILSDDLLLIEDATKDERFADNPLVLGDPHVRFYAGAPLRLGTGSAIGTLCIVDTKPRTITSDQRATLRMLADMVVHQLESTSRNKLEYAFRQELDSPSKRQRSLEPLTRTWNFGALEKLFNLASQEGADVIPPVAVLNVGVQDYQQLARELGEDSLNSLVFEVSSRIRAWLGDLDFFGHIGNGVFSVVLREQRVLFTSQFAEILRTQIRTRPIVVEGVPRQVDTDVGYVNIRDVPGDDFAQVCSLADEARQGAKDFDGLCRGPL